MERSCGGATGRRILGETLMGPGRALGCLAPAVTAIMIWR